MGSQHKPRARTGGITDGQARTANVGERQRPADLRSDVLIVREPIDGMRRFTVRDAPATRDLVHGKPWSVPGRWHGQRNRTGEYYFATTRHHVAFASLEEQSLLLALDHEQSVSGVLSQPFQLVFVRNEKKDVHVPDCFVVRDDGSQEVWDVRPRNRIDAKLTRKAALTREFCRAVGFRYLLFDGLGTVPRHTLTFLHAYSDARRYAPDAQDAETLLAHFTEGAPLGSAWRDLDQPTQRLRMWIYHLLWIGALDMDLNRPLSDKRTIWTRG